MLGLIFLFLITIFGVTLIRLFHIELETPEKWAGGLIIGVVMTTWASFIISLFFNNVVILPIVGLLTAFLSATYHLWLREIKESFKFDWPKNWLLYLTFFVWAVFLLKLFSQMLVTTPEGIWAGGGNVWGDWAGHAGYIANWIYGANFPLQNPWYSGVPFSYPFLFDFTSTTLVKLGMSIPYSLEIPGAIFALSIVILLFKLTVRITKSQLAGAIAVLIFMFSGGLGFVYLIPDKPALLQQLFPQPANGVKELTHVYEANIQWVNFVISEMVPQRGILVGITVALLIFILWLQGFKKKDKKYFLTSGILAGLTPLFHTHTFLVLSVISGIAFLMSRQKIWWYFFIPAGILALPQLHYFLPQVSGYKPGFIHWQPGWTAHVQNDNWLWFWIKNIGLMFFLIPITWLTSFKIKRKLFFMYVPFLVIFVASNLWIFQPWENDNSKLLRFWYLASSILVAWWLVEFGKKAISRKIIAFFILFLAILSGIIDSASWLNFDKNKLLLWGKGEIKLGQEVREITPKEAIFLTTDAHNHWVVDLAGRKIVMGFRGWLWSWGINYSERERDVIAMFSGDTVKTPELLAKYKVNYVVIGPGEKQNFAANENYFLQHYPVIVDEFGQKIFKIS